MKWVETTNEKIVMEHHEMGAMKESLKRNECVVCSEKETIQIKHPINMDWTIYIKMQEKGGK